MFNRIKTLILTAVLATSGTVVANADIGVIINEIMPANIDILVDPSWNYGGFVEFYNPTASNIILYGHYLSDDPDNLLKWRIPDTKAVMRPGNFYTVWFDHNDMYAPNQCSFELGLNGGTLYLADKSGNIEAQVDYPAAVRRCSYARTTDAGDEWSWCVEPTQGKTNATATFASEQLEAPVVNKNGQVFSGTLQVVVNIPSGAKLRYTTNGSVPTTTNGSVSTTGVFSVNKSTVYRFRLFKDGYLPSDVVTRSFIYNDKNFCVPIISIVTDDKNINSQEYGIFVQGSGNGRAGRGQNVKCNWNMDWDRPVSMEYIKDGDEVCFAQEVNMAMCGGWSRAWTPHSFKLKANKLYGLKYLPYSFFDKKPYVKSKTLQVRNGGNDNSCRFIDPALQQIVARSGLDIDYQEYQPAFVYINGQLYDVLNIREANNKHFAYSNRGYDDDEIDQFEIDADSNYVQMEGTKEAFNEWYRLAKYAERESNYEEIKKLVDVDEFVNYMAVELYLGGNDWPNNNIKAYRPRIEGGKFRFVLFDLDAAFSYSSTSFNEFGSKQYHTFAELLGQYHGSQRTNAEIEIVSIFLNMLKNDEFRKQFIDTFCLVTGSVFNPDRCREIATELANYADKAMNQVSSGWWGGASCWNSANTVINNLSAQRQNTMITALKNYAKMQLSGQTAVKCSFKSNISEGRILMNGQPVPTNRFNGQLFLPVTLHAEAPAGYKFAGWAKEGGTKQTTAFDFGSQWSYYDKGSLDGRRWNQQSYSASWSSGKAPLGYSTGGNWTGINTQLTQQKSTYYFRRAFSLDFTPNEDSEFLLSFTVDDGCIIYVNGTEVHRFNMPSGTVSYSTFSSTYVDGQFDLPQTITIPSSLLKKGSNLIAVEVHNNNSTSSDAYWDASLVYKQTTVGGMASTEQDYVLPADAANVNVTAVWEPLSDEELLIAHSVPVRINEVSAGNSIYVNEYFSKEDWIELYNTTDKSIDLAGMYLSDNVDKPQKFQFKQGGISTVIEPHGYRVVWCDKSADASQLHASFKLGNELAFVLLTSADQSWADTLQYCPHDGIQTVGRYPDGANSVYAMNVPTIGKSNTICSYDTVHIELTPAEVEEALSIEQPSVITHDGNMSIAYSNGYVIVKSEAPTDAQLYIVTVAGQQVAKTALRLADGHAAYGVNLPSGVYLAVARDAEGHQCVTKFYR